jgi:hypothetical protein
MSERTFQGDYDECDETEVRTHYCVRCGGPLNRSRFSGLRGGEYRIAAIGDGGWGFAHLVGDRNCYVGGDDDE